MSGLIYTRHMSTYSTDNTWHAYGTVHCTAEPTFSSQCQSIFGLHTNPRPETPSAGNSLSYGLVELALPHVIVCSSTVKSSIILTLCIVVVVSVCSGCERWAVRMFIYYLFAENYFLCPYASKNLLCTLKFLCYISFSLLSEWFPVCLSLGVLLIIFLLHQRVFFCVDHVVCLL